MVAPGEKLGSYRIIEAIGAGGMGMVFRAEHMVLRRRVALKVLKPQLAQAAEALARFFTEAEVVNRIGHEHIVDITDFGTTPAGESYFVMEYLEGESLAHRLRRTGALSIPSALHVCRQLSDALAASHQAGVLHRDVKPGNVFLIRRAADTDYVKLFDFGLAKVLDPASRPLTRTGDVNGTPHYMSPEQCRGMRSGIDHRTDIYSLGILLFELLTGAVPFHDENVTTLMFMHMTGTCPDVRTRRGEIPAEVAAIVERATRKQPQERFGSMAEMRDALLPLCAAAPPLPAPSTEGPLDPGHGPTVKATVPPTR